MGGRARLAPNIKQSRKDTQLQSKP